MSAFDEFLDFVIDGAKDLAREVLQGFEQEASDDAREFLETIKTNLMRWTTMLAQGELREQDFDDLVRGQRRLAEMHSLTRAGIELTTLDRLRTKLVDLIVDTALDTFGP